MDQKPVSKQTLYQIASLHSRDAIERLVSLMGSTNENVALGAAKTLLGKTLPDLKSEERHDTVSVGVDSINPDQADEQLKKIFRDLKELGVNIPDLVREFL